MLPGKWSSRTWAFLAAKKSLARPITWLVSLIVEVVYLVKMSVRLL